MRLYDLLNVCLEILNILHKIFNIITDSLYLSLPSYNFENLVLLIMLGVLVISYLSYTVIETLHLPKPSLSSEVKGKRKATVDLSDEGDHTIRPKVKPRISKDDEKPVVDMVFKENTTTRGNIYKLLLDREDASADNLKRLYPRATYRKESTTMNGVAWEAVRNLDWGVNTPRRIITTSTLGIIVPYTSGNIHHDQGIWIPKPSTFVAFNDFTVKSGGAPLISSPDNRNIYIIKATET